MQQPTPGRSKSLTFAGNFLKYQKYMNLWHPLDGLIGIALAGIIAAVSYRFRMLTGGGACAAFFMGSVVFALGRVGFSIPMLVFFTSSSLLSKLGYERKSKLVSHIAKTSKRDSMQVLANGLVPTLLLISWYFSQNNIFSFLYVAVLACATADTWATELGVLSSQQPRSIVGFRPTSAGASGGITLAGMVAAFVGAAFLGVVGLWALKLEIPFQFHISCLLVLICAAFLGQVCDSVMGATWQARYVCQRCGRITEVKSHCPDATVSRVAGVSWVNNDVVNLFAGSFAALFCWIGLAFIC